MVQAGLDRCWHALELIGTHVHDHSQAAAGVYRGLFVGEARVAGEISVGAARDGRKVQGSLLSILFSLESEATRTGGQHEPCYHGRG